MANESSHAHKCLTDNIATNVLEINVPLYNYVHYTIEQQDVIFSGKI